MNMQVLVLNCVKQYQQFATQRAAKGMRPVMLKCEKDQDEHCSVRFARFVKEHGVIPAVTDLCGRCPFGAEHAFTAMTWSAVMAVASPFVFTTLSGDCCDLGSEADKLCDC